MELQWTEDGSHLLCQDGANVHMLELESGQVTSTFNCMSGVEDIKDDPVTALTVSDDEFGKYLFTSYRSGLIIKWCRTGNYFLSAQSF